jgi:2-oxoglutarate dehydrogenase E1 component
MNPWDQFSGVNAGYVYDLYERYLTDPTSVDEATRALFATWSPDAEPAGPADQAVHTADTTAAIAAFTLAE